MKPYGVLCLMMPFLAVCHSGRMCCVCALCDDVIMALENDHLTLWELENQPVLSFGRSKSLD